MPTAGATETLAALRLVDQHCHGVTAAVLTRPGLERLLTEGAEPAGGAATGFDTALGASLRRWCAPVLDLPAHAQPDDYVARRAELGTEASRRLLAAAGADDLLVDGGYQPADPLPAGELAAAAGARLRELVRLESVAEEVAAAGVGAAEFAPALAERLAERAVGAVGLKSIAAYRVGLDLDPAPPSAAEVTAAAGRWLAGAGGGRPRLADPILVRHLLWTGARLGLPVQLHTGFGDPDLRLHRSDPALLTDFCVAVAGTGTALVLLHCYPFHRQAGYLAAVFPNVYVDLGLTLNYLGPRAGAVLAETMELAPFGKLLYSSDAFGLAELYHLGALRFRAALGGLLDRRVADGELSAGDAARYAELAAGDTARHVYRIG